MLVMVLALMLSALAGGCHLAFDGKLPTVSCLQEGVYGEPACPEGQTCSNGRCALIGKPLGAGCNQDEECVSDAFCLRSSKVAGAESGICSRPCCRSEDCGVLQHQQVCWSLVGQGGHVCQPAAGLGRQALGVGRAGSACSSDGDCRSGRCVSKRCSDVCCEVGGCPEQKDVCRLVASDGWADGKTNTIWGCARAAYDDGAQAGVPCETNGQCVSSLCVEPPDDVELDSICGGPCCSSQDCGTVSVEGLIVPLACDLDESSGMRACAKLLSPEAVGRVGDPCSNHKECRGGFCFESTGGDAAYCSDACCQDADCGDGSRFVCRPVSDAMGGKDSSWSLRCVAK